MTNEEELQQLRAENMNPAQSGAEKKDEEFQRSHTSNQKSAEGLDDDRGHGTFCENRSKRSKGKSTVFKSS